MELNQKSGNHQWRGRLIKAGGGILLIFATGLSIFTWKLFSPPSVDLQPLPKTLVSLELPEGQQLLSKSKSKQDFQPLSTLKPKSVWEDTLATTSGSMGDHRIAAALTIRRT
ncbi:hypothetical protein IQ252_00405 [Tychonema sp. LEGE 07203]|nr:hypothetical protein [Tychonema sp. LEGE 07203]